jgi:predicted membrane-bound dolichyl-phosphate-mannose-protein mannosyltransferase
LRSALRSSTSALAGAESSGTSTSLALAGMLFVALLVRLVLINADGFHNDVSTFESWALTLADHPLREFFAKAGFADYPPGYFFILWIVGHAYRALVHSDPTYSLLKIAIKLPAILADLLNAYLVFAIVRRFSTLAWAFGSAAFVAFNPAFIFISAYWGQVDSVAGALTLGVLLLAIHADRSSGRTAFLSLAGAWFLLAYSILMKPPAIVLVPVLLIYPFATSDAAIRALRLRATAAGIVASFALAYLAALAFNPGWSPLTQFGWLFGRYAYASGVYPYSSVNAFNLYAMVHHFWEPDSQLLPSFNVGGRAVGIPQFVWGVSLMLAAMVLVCSRFLQRRDSLALLEAAMLLSLGYFVLSTRMHERYIFNAVLLAAPLMFARRRYLYAAILLTITLTANLFYSLEYLHVLDAKIPGVDPTDLSPLMSHSASVLNVLTFFYLGYAYLGGGGDAIERVDVGGMLRGAGTRARRLFAPLEGLVAMTRLDVAIACGLTACSFVLSYISYQWPSEKIFDEIYYARAGEEYLSHKEIFEFTHPPLTKLLVTLSMILFGGLHGGGDTSQGWRFLNLVVGALMIFVVYGFAKRLLGSTPFATLVAGMLLFDGFHYVQSRIATPEITVAFFAVLTLYAFYRFWIASEVRVALLDRPLLRAESYLMSVAMIAAFGVTAALLRGQSLAAHVVIFGYLLCGAYAAIRLIAPRFLKAAATASYADGARVTAGALRTLDGGIVPAAAGGELVAGESTRIEKGMLLHTGDGLRIEYARGGRERYATAQGEALFEPEGTMRAGGALVDGRRDGLIWLILLALSAGCLGASKWNGLFDFGVVWLLAGLVVSQRYLGVFLRSVGLTGAKQGPAQWGNPFGFSLDILVTTMLFIGGTIYLLCYIPYFGLGHNLADLVGLQQQMFGYHYDLKATHPYGSKWWQWPLLLRPISYYYHDWRTGAAASNAAACCVAEILALPNPAVWWLGLVSVPLIAFLGWRERNKGCVLLVTAYFLQWLPWIASPRVAFEYHFFPNLAVICLANGFLLQRVWRLAEGSANRYSWPRLAVWGYAALVVGLFAYFYPVLAGSHVPWNVWDSRMWHWLMRNQWV